MKKKIAILGSTGSIGKSTLDIIRKDKKNFDIILLSANNNYKKLISQAKEFKPRNILINNVVNLENIFTAIKLNVVYLVIAISLFYFSFNVARKKGTLINIGE